MQDLKHLDSFSLEFFFSRGIHVHLIFQNGHNGNIRHEGLQKMKEWTLLSCMQQ